MTDLRGAEPMGERILRAAGELFAERGYRATSMQAIAQRVGITKAAVYYHFPSKDEILHRLTVPLLDELERAFAEADACEDPETVRWQTIEAFVDIFLAHRTTLVMLVRDMTLLAQAPVAERFRAVMRLANDLVCGPDHRLAWRVRAAQVVASLTDPVVLFHDVPAERLRTLLLDGARTLLSGTQTGELASPQPRRRPRGRNGGRPTLLSEHQTAEVRRLYASGSRATEIAARFGVSRATIYRCLKT